MHDAIRLRDALGLSNREARSEAELLLMRALQVTRADLIARPELAAQAATNETYLRSLERRLAGEPIAYILAEREFYGHVFSVGPDVLIPRPETELLVDMALERIRPDAPAKVLDLGTGSGAIAIAIALERPHVKLLAVDASVASLRVAEVNCERLLGDNERLSLVQSDWFDAVGESRFDLIVSNPPYVAEGDAHLTAGDVRFEPGQALVAGSDGLHHLRHIISQAPRYLDEGGWLLCEHGYDQAAACRRMLQQAGFVELAAERDLAGIVRVSGGRWLTADASTG
jgi:release factor glutamine methyltransferase